MQASRTIRFAAVLLILAVLVPTQVSAQVSLELQGGALFPTGDLNEYWGIGFTAGGTVLYELTPFVSIGVNLAYSKTGLDDGSVRAAFDLPDELELEGGAASIFSACGEIRAHAGAMDMATVFAGVGFGLFNIGLTDMSGTYEGDTETVSFDRENQPGGYIHAGAAVNVSPMVKLGIKGQMTFYATNNSEEAELFELGESRNYFSLIGALIIGF